LYKIFTKLIGYRVLLSPNRGLRGLSLKGLLKLLGKANGEFEKQLLESLLRDEITHETSLQEEIRLHVENPQGLKYIVYGTLDALVSKLPWKELVEHQLAGKDKRAAILNSLNDIRRATLKYYLNVDRV